MKRINISKIKGFENCKNFILYENGKVFSIKTNSFLKLSKDSKGYLCLDLRRYTTKLKYPKIHRLIMFAFKGMPIGNKNQVNHIDGNKENNDIRNLEYVSNYENRRHALKNNLKNEIDYHIEVYNKKGNLVGTFLTATEAIEILKIENGKPGNIGRAVKGSRKTAYGYIWKQKKFND